MMHHKKILILFLTLCCANLLHACPDTTAAVEKKNAVTIEILGKGLIWSTNYERVFYRKQQFHLSMQAGTGFYGFDSPGYIPIPISCIARRQLAISRWFIETSIGGVALLSLTPTPKVQRDEFRSHPRDYGRPFILPFDVWYEGSLGICYQKRWMFKALYVPIYGRSWSDLIYYYATWGGISIGKAF